MGISQKILFIYRKLVENLYTKPKNVIKLFKQKELYNSISYFPERPSRPVWKNYLFQIGQILKYSIPNVFYFMYGLDVKTDEERNEYVNYKPFMDRRNFLNYGNNQHNSTCILRNKLYFDIFAKSIGINVPQIKAYYSQGQLFIWKNGFKKAVFSDLSDWDDINLFCKEIEGECGIGIFILSIVGGKLFVQNEEITAEEFQMRIKGADYLFQEIIEQHPEMSKLYSGSINTMRLVTVRSLKDHKLHILPSILRIGANGSFVDNTSQGGIAVGFDLETGQLHQYGFYKPQFGLKTELHPNSGIRLSDFSIPMIKEAEQMALHFHSMLKDIHSIGWDIAIGPDGPIFIEGNDNWEINGPQVGNHGFRKEFLEYFFD